MSVRHKSASAKATAAANKRSARNVRRVNQRLLVSSVHQHELTAAAEKLNDDLRAEIGKREQAVATLRESEERYRTLFDLGPVAVYSCDTAGVIERFNRRAAELWGRKPAPGDTDELFCGSFKLFRPDGSFLPHEQCPMAEVVSGKISAVHDAEVLIERPDGSRVTVIVNIRPLKNERGEITGAINCFYDITERKQAENARARLASIVESSDDAIISKDLDGIITSWNRGAEHLFGYSAGEAIGQPITMLMPPDHCDEEPRILERIRHGESIEHYETVRRRKDGTMLNISLTVSPIKNVLGQVVGASKVARDITYRKQVEDALRQARDRLASQADELERQVVERTAKLRDTVHELEAFSYSVAHDMRAPLRSMQGFATTLLEQYADKLNETGVDYLKRIARSSTRLDYLIKDVLNYTKILRAEVPLDQVDLDRLVRDIVDTYANFQPPQADLRIEGTLPNVRANQAWLTQCFSNLLSNAVKFVSPETVPYVKIWAEPIDDHVRVWIQDNGIGIAPQDHDRIFRLFERVYPDKQFQGTGIGLTIARKAVERMGGEMGFESDPGQGTRFWVQLPKG